MIEAEKMLHLRKYMAFLRIGAKSRVARLHLHSSLRESVNHPPYKGYVSRYVHCSPVQTHLRPETYTAKCVRTFSSTVPQSSVDDIDHKVMSFCDDAKQGRVSSESLKEIIKLCHEREYHLPHSAGILLLRCCGSQLPDLKPTDKEHLVDQVWQLIKKNNGELTLDCYNTLLDVYAENSTSVDSKKFLDSMTVEPNEHTYHSMLNITAKTGNMNHLQDIMSTIREKNIIFDEKTFNKLVQTYAISGKTAEAEYIITLMRDMKLHVDKAYTELACGYAKFGDIPNLVKILNDESLSNANLLRILKVLSTSDNGRYIPVVLNYLMASLPEIKSEISKLIVELIRLNRAVDAHTIINCIGMNDATKDIVNSFVNTFLDELIIVNAPIDDIIKYASDFMESGHDPYALTNTAEISLKLGRGSLCLAIFQAMRSKNIEIRPHYYWPLLTIVQKEGEAKVYALIDSMYKEGVELDFDTMFDYVYPYVNTADPSVTLRRLHSYDIPGTVIFAPLIAFLLYQNRVQDALLVCKSSRVRIYCRELLKPLVNAYFATRDTKSCVAILMVSPKGQEFITSFLKLLLKDEHSAFFVEDMECILNEFICYNAKIMQRDADILKNILLNRYVDVAQDTNLCKLIDSMVDETVEYSALTSLQRRHMTTKELHYHLVELRSKELNTKTLLRKLMEVYMYERNMKKFEEIKREFDECRYEWTPGLKIILFEWYVRCNKLQEAEAVLSDVLASDFAIDNTKILLFATALVEKGNFNAAFETIKSINNVVIRNDSSKYCKNFLNAVARSQYCSRTKDMLSMLIEKKYCEFSTEMLRPLVAVPLERNDLSNAVKVFMTCYDKYKKTPLAVDLLTAMLKQRDGSKWKKDIETVYEAVVDTKGLGSANVLVAIALATLNKTQELQSVLKNFNQPFSMKSLEYYFAYIQRNNNIDALVTILKEAPNNHTLDLVKICQMILFFYSKVGNVNDALELWKIMCAKDIEPSRQFRVNFCQFLLSNKVPLPPEFEQYNDEINVSKFSDLNQ